MSRARPNPGLVPVSLLARTPVTYIVLGLLWPPLSADGEGEKGRQEVKNWVRGLAWEGWAGWQPRALQAKTPPCLPVQGECRAEEGKKKVRVWVS